MVVKDGLVLANATLHAFGLVHRDVGVPQQRMGVFPIIRVARDPNARPDFERQLMHDEWQLRAREQPLGDRLEHLEVARYVARQDREFISTEPGDEARWIDRFGEARSEVVQQDVAVVVAERVVDLFESVEIDQQDPERPSVALAALDLLLDPRSEHFAVGEAGEIVGGREPLQLFGALL